MIRILILLLCCSFLKAEAQLPYPAPTEATFTTPRFQFESGESLSDFRQHYYTLGTPKRDSNGKVANAILVLHGTTSAARNLLSAQFAGLLFGKGQTLDADKYFIIIPDGIGHGKSSKPSDGLHMKFPKYTYNDMVKAQYELLTHLNVNHLRLILGTSMGGMQAWVWGYTYPGFSDALMPLATLPTEIAGRNRMMRKMAIDLIEMDPEWKNGEYTQQPKLGLAGALSSFFFMGSSPLQLQKSSPDRIRADAAVVRSRNGQLASLDANDVIYALHASREYNPSPYLSKIEVPVFAVNSADDEINPPELGIMEQEIKKVEKGRYILLPITDQTTGHSTNSLPAVWGKYLEELMRLSE